MKITNPIDKKIEVVIKGSKYSIEANGSIDLPKEIAIFWKDKIHQFLLLSESKKIEEVIEVKEVVVEAKEEIIAPVEEVIIESSIKKSKKNK